MPHRAGPAPTDGRRARSRWVAAVVAMLYVVAGFALWWHAWRSPASAIAAGSADPDQNVWWLTFLPHALGRAMTPFFTRAMYFPAGVNVVSNTSFPFVALVLSPVTVAFGPLVSFNLAVSLVPAANAFAAFAVLRRYVQWDAAAFVGALLYGFGPFVGTDLRFGHLNLTVLVVPPLFLGVLDTLVRGRHRSAMRVGIALWALVVVQFFVSTEMCALMLVVGALYLAVAAVAGRRLVRSVAVHVAGALATAAVLATGALAYPVWYYLRGPRHFTGAVWGDMTGFSATLASFVVPHGQLVGVSFLSGGNGSYLGVPLLVALAAAVVVWRHDTLLVGAVVLTALCLVLALGPSLHVGRHDTGIPMPGWPLLHLPLLTSLAASRFSAFADLFAGAALGLALTHVRRAVGGGPDPSPRHRLGLRVHGAVVAVSAACLLPIALVLPWPYATRPAVQPEVVGRVLAATPEGTVIREYPPVSGTDASWLLWQAETDLHVTLVDGYAIVPGPGGHATVRPPAGVVDAVEAGVFLRKVRAPFAASTVEALRSHVWDEGARLFVVLRSGRKAATMTALLRAALGPPDLSLADAVVWSRP